MDRFMGMMPSDEVGKEEMYAVGSFGGKVTVQSGKKGWTIIYADYSTDFKDVDDTTENNFNFAMSVLKDNFDDIKVID